MPHIVYGSLSKPRSHICLGVCFVCLVVLLRLFKRFMLNQLCHSRQIPFFFVYDTFLYLVFQTIMGSYSEPPAVAGELPWGKDPKLSQCQQNIFTLTWIFCDFENIWNRQVVTLLNCILRILFLESEHKCESLYSLTSFFILISLGSYFTFFVLAFLKNWLGLLFCWIYHKTQDRTK